MKKSDVDLNKKKECDILTLERWVEVLFSGNQIDVFLHKYKVETLAVYGYGRLGRLLVKQLRQSNLVNLAYVVDQNKTCVDYDIPFFLADDSLHDVDMVIVTSVYYYNEIRSNLVNKGIKSKILSLYDLLNLIDSE